MTDTINLPARQMIARLDCAIEGCGKSSNKGRMIQQWGRDWFICYRHCAS